MEQQSGARRLITRPVATKPTTAKIAAKRLALTFQFMREVIADPTRLGDIPASGAMVIVVPGDDPEFVAHEREIAERLREDGRQTSTSNEQRSSTTSNVTHPWSTFDEGRGMDGAGRSMTSPAEPPAGIAYNQTQAVMCRTPQIDRALD